MPVKTYEVIVGVSSEQAHTNEVAIAEAARYLCYVDTTDKFGYCGCIHNTHVYGGEGEDDWGVALTFDITFDNEIEQEVFEDELQRVARVETIEEVS